MAIAPAMTTASGRPALPLLLSLVLGATAGAAYPQAGHAPGPTGGMAPQRGGEVRLAPPALVRLAGKMGEADPIARWDFADTLLDVLLETYRDELTASHAERIADKDRAARLARWQAATARLVEDLIAARRALGEGAEPTLQVDGAGQVLLFIGRLPVVFSPPRPGTENALMDLAVDRYCARHRCDTILSPASATASSRSPRGSWSLRQGMRPVYAIADRLHCRFTDLAGRETKAMRCEAVAVETERLRDAVVAAGRQGVAIDWPWMAGQPPRGVPEAVIELQPAGRYLRLALPLLSRLSASDWRRIVDALDPSASPAARTPVIEEGERLLDTHRG